VCDPVQDRFSILLELTKSFSDVATTAHY